MKLKEMVNKFGGCCSYCGRQVQMKDRTAHPLGATRDHVVPRSQGGGGGRNLVLACRACNLLKGDMPLDQFLSIFPQGAPRRFVGLLIKAMEARAAGAEHIVKQVNRAAQELIRMMVENYYEERRQMIREAMKNASQRVSQRRVRRPRSGQDWKPVRIVSNTASMSRVTGPSFRQNGNRLFEVVA